MFSITPIGSCRITTPLRRGQSVHGFRLNLSRCYGYCHSPGEAVQMARFMQGAKDLPADAWPFISRAHDLEQISNARHAHSDLYVVEISSAKEITLEGVYIQLNYLKTAFPEFFKDPQRAQNFWAVAEQGTADALSAFLGKEWSETQAQRTESETLSNLRLRIVTPKSLRHNIAELMELLGEVLFVSHVAARKPDGKLIKSRSKFIDLVEKEVTACGGQFFNPTHLMADFGQTAAIEDESAGLAHFTESFGDEMMHVWMRDVIAPQTDQLVRTGGREATNRFLVPQVDAAREHGRFTETSSRLSALRYLSEPLHRLHREFTLAQSKAGSAFEDEYKTNGVDDLNDADVLDAMNAAFVFGRFDIARAVTEERPSTLSHAPLYRLIDWGALAQNCTAPDLALKFFFEAARRGSTRGQNALIALAKNNKTDVLAVMDPEFRAEFLGNLEPLERLQFLHLNEASPVEAVNALTDPHDVFVIADHLTKTHSIGHGAEVIARWRLVREADRIVDAELVALLDGWVEVALEADEITDRIHGLNAVLFAAPLHATARNQMRDTRKELALLIRSAGKAGDIDTLDSLTNAAKALTRDLPELDLWRARLRFATGEYEAAIELGLAASVQLPEKINNWVLLMRAANKIADHSKSAEFARKVVDLATPETEKLKLEAEAVLRPAMAAI